MTRKSSSRKLGVEGGFLLRMMNLHSMLMMVVHILGNQKGQSGFDPRVEAKV